MENVETELGYEVSYQWKKGGEVIPGANARTFQVTPKEESDFGPCVCEIRLGKDGVCYSIYEAYYTFNSGHQLYCLDDYSVEGRKGDIVNLEIKDLK